MGDNNPEMKAMYGLKLAELRQAANLSAENVASKLRIRSAIINDIESGNVDLIPVVFLRGYIKSYAALVNLPEDELAKYLEMIGSTKPNPVLMKNYARQRQEKQHKKRITFWMLIILAIIIVISGVYLWQSYQGSQTAVTHSKSSQRIMQELADG